MSTGVHSEVVTNELRVYTTETRESLLKKIAIEESAFRAAMKADVPFEAVKEIRVRINKITAHLHLLSTK